VAKTTYADLHGERFGFTPTAEGDYVQVTTKARNLGFFKIERFGPDPITPAGRLRAGAVAHFGREFERVTS